MLDANKSWRAWRAKEKTKGETASIRMLCGAGSGVITKSAIAPLERMKILFQVQTMFETGKGHYGNSMSGAARTIMAEEGIKGFYKGNAANCFRVMPNYALKFTFNDTFKELVKRRGQTEPLSVSQLMAAGSLAGSFQLSCTYPMEVIRTRLSLSSSMLTGGAYKGMWDCARRTVASEGWKALYNGYPVSLIFGTPYVGIQMTAFALLKRAMPVDPVTGKMDIIYKLLSGSLAGLTAQTLIFPGDTLRRRLQTDGAGGTPTKYKNFVDCMKKVVAADGIQGLYRGLVTNVVRCIPGAAIQFAAYDALKNFAGVAKKT